MSIDDLLRNDLIHVDERDDEAGHYVFRIGQLQTPITLLVRKPYRGRVVYEISHAIKTPLQGMPYLTSHPQAETRQWALWRALEGVIGHYREAVREGHKPDESWLVPTQTRMRRARR